MEIATHLNVESEVAAEFCKFTKSHKTLQVLTLLGVVASVCTGLYGERDGTGNADLLFYS